MRSSHYNLLARPPSLTSPDSSFHQCRWTVDVEWCTDMSHLFVTLLSKSIAHPFLIWWKEYRPGGSLLKKAYQWPQFHFPIQPTFATVHRRDSASPAMSDLKLEVIETLPGTLDIFFINNPI